jgi:hypothetical protein
MTMTRVGAVLAVLAIATAVPAHADEQGYISDLRAHGVPVIPGLEQSWIGQGYMLCNQLRSGVSRANVAQSVTQADPVVFMDVLQHQLCPDTLR